MYRSAKLEGIAVTFAQTEDIFNNVLPSEVDYEEELRQIKRLENPLEYTLELFLWLQKSQMFIDGNKRTANLVANHELIQNGLGIITIPVELTGTYKQKLVEYYETGNSAEMKKFLWENCMDGVE